MADIAGPQVQARGIVKIFCQHRALDGVDSTVHSDEEHALFGLKLGRKIDPYALQAKLGWFRALNRDEQDEIAGRYAEDLDIRAANHEMPVKLLSGGNQQKVVLARWQAIDPQFLILDEPTRGIDVGAHAQNVRTITRLREEGLALLVILSELDEVVAHSNRVVVMRDRAVVAALLVGLLCGWWNSALVTYLDIQPIIATLVLMVAGRGLVQLVTEGSIVPLPTRC